MFENIVQELLTAFFTYSDTVYNGWGPRTIPPGPQCNHRDQFSDNLVRSFAIRLVHHVYIRDLQDTSLKRLNFITHPRNADNYHCLHNFHNVDFILSRSYGLDDHKTLTCSIHYIYGIARRL